MACSSLLGVDWWESLVGSWRSSQERLPETARLRVDREGWGSKTKNIQEFRSIESSSIGFWASKTDWRERRKKRQVQFPLLRLLTSLGQRREERAVQGMEKARGS